MKIFGLAYFLLMTLAVGVMLMLVSRTASRPLIVAECGLRVSIVDDGWRMINPPSARIKL